MENLDVKIPLYKQLGKITKPTAILGSNTSSLAIADFARPSGRPEKVVSSNHRPLICLQCTDAVGALCLRCLSW